MASIEPRRESQGGGKRLACSVAVAVQLVASCGGEPAAEEGSLTNLAFAVDAPIGEEAYACFGFDAGAIASGYLRAIRWRPPEAGSVVLHHASLFALAENYPDGPLPCDIMPAAWTMNVWAPGES